MFYSEYFWIITTPHEWRYICRPLNNLIFKKITQASSTILLIEQISCKLKTSMSNLPQHHVDSGGRV
ncbi:unnamed protein product, partial [Schistosoma guineensis]